MKNNLNVSRIKTFCLSMEQSIDRRTHMKSEFARAEITNFLFWNGFTSNSQEVTEFYSSGKVLSFPPCFRCKKIECDCKNNYLMPTQVANFLGFMSIFHEIATKESDEFFLICEDDIVFHLPTLQLFVSKFNIEVLQKNNYTEDSAFLCRLGGTHKEIEDTNTIKLSNRIKMSNWLFLINKTFAKSIIKKFEKIEETSDMFIHRTFGSKTNHSTVSPPLCHELSAGIGTFPSLIRPRKATLPYLKSKGDLTTLKELKTKHEQHIDKIQVSKLLVLGYPIKPIIILSHKLKIFRINIGINDLKKSGIGSCLFAVDEDSIAYNTTYSIYAKNRKHNFFYHTCHIVPNPWDFLIEVLNGYRTDYDTYMFLKKHIEKQNKDANLERYNELEREIMLFYYWHIICEQQNIAITIRNSDSALKLASLINPRMSISKFLYKIFFPQIPKNLLREFIRFLKLKIVHIIVGKKLLHIDIDILFKLQDMTKKYGFKKVAFIQYYLDNYNVSSKT